MPPLEMWSAPLEHCEAAVAAEQEEWRACGWGCGEAVGEECLLANVRWWYGGLAEASGAGAWFLPPTEEVAESGYCMELGITCGGGSIGDGVGDGVEAVDNSDGRCDSWNG